MMEIETVRKLIAGGLEQSEVQVQGDGRHFEAVIISPVFEGKSLVQRHQMVYALVKKEMESDLLHALSMKTFTPEQWAAQGN